MHRLLRTRGRVPALATLLASVAACLLARPNAARAEGFALNRYSPAETVHDGFALSRPDDRGHGRFGFRLELDHANDPLVLEVRPGDADSERARVVSDQLVAHVGLHVGLWERLVLFAGLDVNLLMRGESFVDPAVASRVDLADGTGLGDARVGARLRLFGEQRDLAALAVQVGATLPVANAADDAQSFAGESSLSLLPELLFELRPGSVRITANAGVQLRPDQEFGDVALEDELRFGLGVTVPAAEQLDLLAEVYGSSVLTDLGNRESSPLEVLAGGKYWVGEPCALSLAGGAGLQRGVGAPDFRALAGFGCELPDEPEVAEPEPERDSDGDGLLDSVDRCPRNPEDVDRFEDADGCPDPDNDQDTVLDVSDRCVNEPEDADQFEDANGCPDPDNDQDGILDVDDGCKNEPEDKDEFEDADGCPDPDNDKDTVLDVDDECPTAPGVPEQRGCPKSVRVEMGRILILDRVEFATSKDVILERSEPILDEVRATLEANPQLARVRVEGHTDSQGRDQKNMDLSRRRARSVVRWLVEHGVTDQRLEAYGCGENLPVDDNRRSEGRQANRRVEFHIIDPAPSTGVRTTEGCTEAE